MKQTAEKDLYVVVVLILGLCLRLWNINQSFWWDELWSTLPYAKAAHLWETLSSLGYYFNNHILYSLLCRFSIKIFGESEIAARLPSVLLGISSIYVIYYAGIQFFDRATARIAALFLAISPMHIDHSTEARGYAALAFFSLLSSIFFLLALKKNKRSLWVAFSASVFLAFYSHACMIMIALVQCLLVIILVLLKPLRNRNFLAHNALISYGVAKFISAVCVFTVYLPLLSTFIKNIQKIPPSQTTILPFFPILASTMLPGFSSIPYGAIYSALIIWALIELFHRERMVCLYMTLSLLVPPLLFFALHLSFAFERYFIPLLPVALLLLSSGIVRFVKTLSHHTMAQAAMTIVLLSAFVAWSLPSLKTVLLMPRQNYRDAVRYVQTEVASCHGRAKAFSLGHAGNHFQYYANIPIHQPKTMQEFHELLLQEPIVWCLITAWLPDIRRPFEDIKLFTEDPEQMKIYTYLVDNFKLVKIFQGKMPVYVYRYVQTKETEIISSTAPHAQQAF